MRFVKVARAGGVEAIVSANWDAQVAMRRAIERAYVELGRELREAGYLKHIPMAKTGDSDKTMLILDIADVGTRSSG